MKQGRFLVLSKNKRKRICSSLVSIDSFSLLKNKFLAGFKVSEQCEANLGKNYFKVIRNDSPGRFYKIYLEKLACNYGGYRYYFKCPSCSRRMRKLYLTQGFFLCRKCLRLSYQSQKLRPEGRCVLKQHKIENTLKKLGGTLDKKPKWMKKHKFNSLKAKHFDYDIQYQEIFHKKILNSFPI